MTIRHRDMVLPTQPFFSLHSNSDNYQDSVADFVDGFAARSLPVFRLKYLERAEEWSSPAPIVALLTFLAIALKATRILEIGTFHGHTAMSLTAVPGVHVTTVELSKELAFQAQRNIARYKLSDRIDVICGDAGKVLSELSGPFDLAFIDGAKQNYVDYATQSEALLAPGGVIVIDDVFFHGDALNDEPETDKGRGCRALLDHYSENRSMCSSLLAIGNGVLLLTPRA